MELQAKNNYLIKDLEEQILSRQVQKVYVSEATEKAYNLDVENSYRIIAWIEKDEFNKRYKVIEHIKEPVTA